MSVQPYDYSWQLQQRDRKDSRQHARKSDLRPVPPVILGQK